MSKQFPSFTGLLWHRNQYYSFYIPTQWIKSDWPDDRAGVIFSPPDTDPQTLLAVELRDLGIQPTAEDLDDLMTGFIAGIQDLPDCKIETQTNWVRGKLMCLEAKYTFREQDIVRKRWIRQFYHQTRQIAMTAQGATIDAYNYWQPMFFEAMMTTQIHNTLPKPDIEAVR